MSDDSNVISLNVNKDVVTPIVERHIKNAVLEAMGGKDELIAKAVNAIMYQKVNTEGKVDSYSSYNKFTWIDVVFTNKIQEAVKVELGNVMSDSALKIKKALISRLKTDKGASMVADALLAGLSDTFKNTWRANLDIKITPISKD